MLVVSRHDDVMSMLTDPRMSNIDAAVRHVGATLLNTVLDLVSAIELERGTAPVPYLSPQGNGLDELRVRLTPRA